VNASFADPWFPRQTTFPDRVSSGNADVGSPQSSAFPAPGRSVTCRDVELLELLRSRNGCGKRSGDGTMLLDLLL
jgi:hypothetical protein